MSDTYSGSMTKTGNSHAIRFEKGFFQALGVSSQGRFSATILSPGQVLLSIVDLKAVDDSDSPVMGAFLSFIEREFTTNPQQAVSPVTEEMLEQAQQLSKIVPPVSDSEEFPDDVLD